MYAAHVNSEIAQVFADAGVEVVAEAGFVPGAASQTLYVFSLVLEIKQARRALVSRGHLGFLFFLLDRTTVTHSLTQLRSQKRSFVSLPGKLTAGASGSPMTAQLPRLAPRIEGYLAGVVL